MRNKSRMAMALFIVCVLVLMLAQNVMAGPVIATQSVLPRDIGPIALEPDPWERPGWNLLGGNRQSMDGWNLRASFRMIEEQTVADTPKRAEVVINWDLPLQLATSQQAVKYNVYRSTAVQGLFEAKNRLNDFAMTNLTIKDSVAVGRYYYAIQAVQANGSVVSSSAPMEANVVPVTAPTLVGTQPATTEHDVPTSNEQNGPIPMYLKVEGIPGSITEGGFAGWSHVQDYEWGLSHAEGTPQPVLGRLVVTREIDSSSAPLQLACYKGDLLPKVTLTVCSYEAGRDLPFYRFVLSNAKVANFTVEPNGYDLGLLEKLEFTYDGLKVEGYEDTNLTAANRTLAMIAVDYSENQYTAPEPSTKVPTSSHQSPQGSAMSDGGTYLTMTGIPGPVTLPVNAIKYAMDVIDFNFTGSRAMDGSVSGQVTINKNVDSASVRLVTACIGGQQIPQAVLDVSGSTRYICYRVTLSDVRVVEIASRQEEYDHPFETVTLCYNGIKIESRFMQTPLIPGPWTAVQYPSN